MDNHNFQIEKFGELFSVEPANKKRHFCQNGRSKRKRQINPYFLFCKEKRTELQASNPGLSSREVTKILASQWKEKQASEKEKLIEESSLLSFDLDFDPFYPHLQIIEDHSAKKCNDNTNTKKEQKWNDLFRKELELTRH